MKPTFGWDVRSGMPARDEQAKGACRQALRLKAFSACSGIFRVPEALITLAMRRSRMVHQIMVGSG